MYIYKYKIKIDQYINIAKPKKIQIIRQSFKKSVYFDIMFHPLNLFY
jgi:hypothetical protein